MLTILGEQAIRTEKEVQYEHRGSDSIDGSQSRALEVIAFVVEMICGVSPCFAPPDSTTALAVTVGYSFFERDFERCLRTTRGGEPSPNIRALAIVAASRACSAILRGDEARRAVRRKQIRCILALTPGFALWRGPLDNEVRQSQGAEWLGGRSPWQGQQRSATRRIPSPAIYTINPLGLSNKRGFDELRMQVLAIIDQAQAPLPVETLVAALDFAVHTKQDSDCPNSDLTASSPLDRIMPTV